MIVTQHLNFLNILIFSIMCIRFICQEDLWDFDFLTYIIVYWGREIETLFPPALPCHACTSTPASGCGFFLGNYNFSVVVCRRMGEFFTNYLLCIQLSVYTHCIIRIMNWIVWLCGVRREDVNNLSCVSWGCSHWVIYNHRFLILFLWIFTNEWFIFAKMFRGVTNACNQSASPCPMVPWSCY